MAQNREKNASHDQAAQTPGVGEKNLKQKKGLKIPRVRLPWAWVLLGVVCLFSVLLVKQWPQSFSLPEKQIRLGVITLTHNDDNLLPHMLKSVRSYASHVYVCDAQSMDGTTEVAQSFGAEIITMKSASTTSFARTLCLHQVWGRMMDAHLTHALWLEPQDTLYVHQANWLFVSLKDSLYAPVVRISNLFQHRRPLLFNLNASCTFEGSSEALLGCQGVKEPLVFDGIQVLRYVDDAQEDKNRDHLQKTLEKDPSEPHALLYLGHYFDTHGDFERALQLYHQRTLIQDDSYEELSYAHYRLAVCMLNLANNGTRINEVNSTDVMKEEARARFVHAYNLDPFRLEPLYYLARMERTRGNYTQCLLYARSAMGIRYPWQNALFLEVPIYQWALQEELATCLWYTRRPKEAAYYWRDLLDRGHLLGLPEDSRRRIESNLGK